MLQRYQETFSFISSSPEETEAFAKKLAIQASPGTVICLEGDLGAGKTTFCKGFISALTSELPEHIQSPTYIYLNLYQNPNFLVCHFDLYRIQKEEDFEVLGFLDYFDDSHLCLIEWPCKIPSLIPKPSVTIEISYLSETTRRISIKSSKGTL